MDKPVFAIMYDFDKTLCTKDMQEYTFIPNLSMAASDFWGECSALAKREKMDNILAYMYTMIERSRSNHKSIRREDFVKHGKSLELYPGVQDWFSLVNEYGEAHGVTVEHYIISSGVREIIEGSEIAKYFKEIYACEFLYDENGVACWPKLVVNYTTKTQFLFRISKGALEVSDDRKVNEYTPSDAFRVPFTNMLYIGDGLTDVPCMKLVKDHMGHSVAVYNGEENSVVKDLVLHGRVNCALPADYTEDGLLYNTVCQMILAVSK